jgi:hypothetical protein
MNFEKTLQSIGSTLLQEFSPDTQYLENEIVGVHYVLEGGKYNGQWSVKKGNKVLVRPDGDKFRTKGLILDDCKFYIAQNTTKTIIAKNTKSVQSLVYGKVDDIDLTMDEIIEEIRSRPYEPITYNPFKVKEYIKSRSRTPNYDNPEFADNATRQSAHAKYGGEFDELSDDAKVSRMVNDKFSCGRCDRAVFFFTESPVEVLESNLYMINPRPCDDDDVVNIDTNYNGSVPKFVSN